MAVSLPRRGIAREPGLSIAANLHPNPSSTALSPNANYTKYTMRMWQPSGRRKLATETAAASVPIPGTRLERARDRQFEEVCYALKAAIRIEAEKAP